MSDSVVISGAEQAEVDQLRQRVAELEADLRRALSNEAKYRSFFDAESDAVFLVDQAHGHIMDANRSAETLYGFLRDELLSLSLSDLSAEPDATQRLLQSAPGLMPLHYQRKHDGAIFPAEISIDPFAGGERQLMVTVRDITERQRFEDALKQRNRELALLNRATQALTSTLDLNAVLASVLDELRHMLDVSASSIWLIDPDTTEVVCRQATGPHAATVIGWRVAIGAGLVGWTVEHGQSLIVSDAQSDPRHFVGVDHTTGMLMRSIISVPLRVHQTIIGVIQVVDELPNRFDVSALRLIELLANAAAIAVENARLFEETSRRAERLAVLNDLSTSISLPLELNQIMQSAVDGVARMLNVKQVGLALFDETRESLIVSAEKRAHGSPTALGEKLPVVGNKSMEHILATKAPLMIPNAQSDPLLSAVHDLMKRRRIWSMLLAPLVVRGEVIGTLGCDAVDEPRHFTTEEIDLVMTVTNLLAVRVEQARLFSAERDQRRLAEALRESASDLTRTLHLDEVLDRVLEHIGGVVPHDLSGVLLINDQGEAYVARARGPASPADQAASLAVRLPVAETYTLRTMTETGQPLTVPDTRQDSRWVSVKDMTWERSFAGAPIRLKDAIIGFLYVASATPGFYTAQHAERLQAFADQVAVAFENARLYERVRQHAAELEQRVAERTAELQRERNRLQTVFDSAGDGIQIMDLDYRIVYCNPATERITGYSRDEIIGQPSRIFQTLSTGSAEAELAQHLVESGETWTGTLITQRKDGAAVDISVTISPLRDGVGAITGYVAVYRDITRLKELDRLRDQFVSRIGHELRTPLTNLIIYLDLLEHGKDERRPHYLQTLNREADRLRRLVEGFLKIAELDTARVPVDLQPIDFNQFAADVVHRHRAEAARRGIVLLFEPEPAAPAVLADADLLDNILLRLLDNALSYTPAGGSVICTVSRCDTDAPSGARSGVALTIKDTGPGLQPEDLPRLFERFYRGTATRSYAVPGVGLSLAICKAAVDRMNGRITAQSEPGQGAAFTIWLPAA